MGSSRTISQLSIIVQAAVAGAVKDLKDLEAIGKEVGPKIAKGFASSSGEIIQTYDKMLKRITTAFSQNNFSATHLGQLDKLRQFFKEQESIFGEAAAKRAQLVGDLGDYYNSRKFSPIPELHGIGGPSATALPVEVENAFKRLETLKSRLGATDDVSPLITKIGQLDQTFQRLAASGLPLAAAGLERVKRLMIEAQTISNYQGGGAARFNTEPGAGSAAGGSGFSSDYSYGPQLSPAEKTKGIIEGIRSKVPPTGKVNPWLEKIYNKTSLEDLHSMRERLELARSRGTPDQAVHAFRLRKDVDDAIAVKEASLKRQFDKDGLNSRMQGAGGSLGMLSADEIERDRQRANTRRRIDQARGTYSYLTPNWEQTYQGTSPFEKQINSRMKSAEGVQELREIRDNLKKKVAGGNKKLQRQLDRVDASIRRGVSRGLYTLHGNDKSGSVSLTEKGRTRLGRGSNARNFRYVSQNLAYGAEDAIVSYQTGGVAGAARAATNNLTAVAGTMITNPAAAAGAIVGISVLGAILPPMIEWAQAAMKGRDATDQFMASYEKMSKLASRGIELGKITSGGDLRSVRSEMDRVKTELDDANAAEGSLQMKMGYERMRMKQAGGYSSRDDNATQRGARVMFQDVLPYLKWMAPELGFFEGDGKESKNVRESLEAELNIIKGQPESAKNKELILQKQKELESLKAVEGEKKRQHYFDKDFDEGRGEILTDMTEDERKSGRQMSSATFKARLSDAKNRRMLQLANEYRKRDKGLANPEYLDLVESEQRFFDKTQREGVRRIEGRDGAVIAAREQAKEKAAFDHARDYGNAKMIGEKGEAYDRWFQSTKLERDLMRMPAGAKRDALMAANVLDYQKGERDAWDKNHPYQNKPMNTGVDVGTVEDLRLQNAFAFGKPQDPFKKELAERVKAIEGYLRSINDNQEDQSVFEPEQL